MDVRELADAGNRITPLGQRRFPLRIRIGDLLGEAAVLQHGEDAAGPLDLLELRPGHLGELIGAALDVPGTAGRIDHLRQVRLLGEDHVGVAGHAPAEFVWQPERLVERTDGDGIGAAHRRGEAGDGGTQHVHPRIACSSSARR